MLRTQGTPTRARGLRSRAGSRFWAPGVSLHSPPPATGSCRCWLLILGRSPLLECEMRPQEQRYLGSGWHAAPHLGEHKADGPLGSTQPPRLLRGRTLHSLEPGCQQAASTTPGQPRPGPQASVGAPLGRPGPCPAVLCPGRSLPCSGLLMPHMQTTPPRLASQPRHLLVTSPLCACFLICDIG